jgi:hypothetical protein
LYPPYHPCVKEKARLRLPRNGQEKRQEYPETLEKETAPAAPRIRQ